VGVYVARNGLRMPGAGPCRLSPLASTMIHGQKAGPGPRLDEPRSRTSFELTVACVRIEFWRFGGVEGRGMAQHGMRSGGFAPLRGENPGALLEGALGPNSPKRSVGGRARTPGLTAAAPPEATAADEAEALRHQRRFRPDGCVAGDPRSHCGFGRPGRRRSTPIVSIRSDGTAAEMGRSCSGSAYRPCMQQPAKPAPSRWAPFPGNRGPRWLKRTRLKMLLVSSIST